MAREADRQQRRVTGRRCEAQDVLGVGLRDAADDIEFDNRGSDNVDLRRPDNVDDIVLDDPQAPTSSTSAAPSTTTGH